MPTGKPKAGFRRTKKYKGKTVQDIERELAFRVPDIIAELEKLAKPMTCPSCGHSMQVIDKDVGMYLVDRVMGKPRQEHKVDITETIQLSADQIDLLIKRYDIAGRALLGPVIEGEVKVLSDEV